MSRIIQLITKWLPVNDIDEFNKIFNNCKKLKQTSMDLIERISSLLELFKRKHSIRVQYTNNCLQNEMHIQELEDIICTLDVIVDEFTIIFQQLSVKKRQDFLYAHIKLWKTNLWRCKRKICYLLERIINEITIFFIYYGEIFLVLTLKISTCYNKLLSDMDNNSIICNNTCPYLLFPQRKITITKLLQIIANNRAEICCHKLIDCLLETYKVYEIKDDDNTNSDSSSLEIYRALTKHLSPENSPKITKSKQQYNKTNSNDNHFTNIEELIIYEERNIHNLLEVINKITPNLLNNDCMKKYKNGTMKIRQKAIDKILDYYQEILWGEVGNYLEHVILWWGNYPLSSTMNSVNSIQNLRDWISQFIIQKNHLPKIITITLISLTDALCCYITTTLWDQQFRTALVSTIHQNMNMDDTGRLFSNVLNELILLSNQCEVTPDWIIGAPLDELPLVEQIPILHRLDHTIHTIRLWALNQTKRYANNWNVDQFFKITHTDIVDCLNQLDLMKFSNHMQQIEKGGLDVHVQVCALMRNKLTTEIQTNHQNLKETPGKCVECLAIVCRTISLANLQLIFPDSTYWRIVSTKIPEKPSSYVEKFLNQIVTPVLQAINDHTINNMILTIMCQSWLDHIYLNKIKFSQYGALQLLCDFHYIETWLNQSDIITVDLRQRMLNNEILKRCEGVGRLLLRCPGEQIKMIEEKANKIENEIMPAEMYVPNQEQWLELRATKRKNLFKISLCCNNN